MIATRPFQDLTRGFGRNALDLPVAALAGLAVAFVAFAMPGDLLTGAGARDRPALDPRRRRAAARLQGARRASASPARWPRSASSSRCCACSTGPASTRPRPAPAAQEEADMPRLRRRDVHPDAPVRRPISAARDLGEPAPPSGAGQGRGDRRSGSPRRQAEPEPAAEASLDDLMERLAQGLARRRHAAAGLRRRAAAAATPAPQVFPEAGDDRLQSAIESLQRLAARGD